MPRRVYRVCRARYARLDGLGAKLVGGRWNSPGIPVVYMAESVALAVLENLVHMSREDFPSGYVCVGAVIPDEVVILRQQDLRDGFGLESLGSKELGNWWYRSGRSAALEVPSAVVSSEHNYILNPSHPEFRRIEIEPPAIFRFDVRLFSGR